jgi:hypothetical protein
LQSVIEEKNEGERGTRKHSPVYPFVYALKSSEVRRQYPKRLKMLFDYLGLRGSLEEQATEFLENARKDAQWCQDSIIAFLDFHNKRVKSKELAAGTLKNYYLL